jgi:hypothetical protein
MSCPSCGAELADGARFCGMCGSPITASSPPSGPVSVGDHLQHRLGSLFTEGLNRATSRAPVRVEGNRLAFYVALAALALATYAAFRPGQPTVTAPSTPNPPAPAGSAPRAPSLAPPPSVPSTPPDTIDLRGSGWEDRQRALEVERRIGNVETCLRDPKSLFCIP